MNFQERVFRVVAGIPPGRVTSYSWVASLAGRPGAARAVGNIMARNPNPGTGPGRIPCHRVVRSDGSPGGYSGPGGLKAKKRLLLKEGVPFRRGRIERKCFL
jgi:methylated-DNA-[protein]-cysteine S-methyltransferase